MFWGVGVQKILTFSIYEGAFGKFKNRLGMIPGKNIKCMRFRRWKAQVSFVGSLSIRAGPSLHGALNEIVFGGPPK
ncbi:hypothetical protein E2C01_039808 [Portunus trituberculatus]|uniref:Uncharacterized protein n=1 Tax=Portunus trituberculatus TaxID=210409 RepID=A0A5B7FLP3_PORTR|nr:hypothetical protein [Portunus trituberculatus]